MITVKSMFHSTLTNLKGMFYFRSSFCTFTKQFNISYRDFHVLVALKVHKNIHKDANMYVKYGKAFKVSYRTNNRGQNSPFAYYFIQSNFLSVKFSLVKNALVFTILERNSVNDTYYKIL